MNEGVSTKKYVLFAAVAAVVFGAGCNKKERSLITMEEKTVSNENRVLAQYIAENVGINRKVQSYWDDNNENYIDIFSSDDPHDSDVKFYCTIGLSDYPNIIEMKNGNENVPVEILMAAYTRYDKAPNILSTCGFYLLKDKWSCQPGSVFMRTVDFYYSKEMRHIMFTEPFLWEDKLKPLKLESKTVHWLLAIPISEAELQYGDKYGAAALEELFEKNEINIFDLDRKSIIDTMASEGFPFEDAKNTAAITCRHVMSNNQPILYVSHDADDGMWQFLCGRVHTTDKAVVVSLDEIFQHDNSIAAVAGIPLGYKAERTDKNSQWVIYPK